MDSTIAGLEGRFQEDVLAEARATLAPLDTLIFGIGAQKAGTTWLYEQLAKRPDVSLSRKEFSYWTAVRSPYIQFGSLPFGPLLPAVQRRINGPTARAISRLGSRPRLFVESWRALLSQRNDHRAYARSIMAAGRRAPVAGDITPAYAVLSRATFTEMASLHPNARFVFIMRDPVDRLWSGCRHRVRNQRNRENFGEEALRVFRQAVEDPLDTDLLRSNYARTLGELGASVPPERVLVLFFETLFTPETAARIGSFLGLSSFEPNFEQVVLRGPKATVAPTPDDRIRAARALERSYETVFEAFGDQVPGRWRKAWAAA